VRRDADEQLVLAHVFHRLSCLVHPLTVQIFKDDWTRGAAYAVLGSSSFSMTAGKKWSSNDRIWFPGPDIHKILFFILMQVRMDVLFVRLQI
jgi:hypothetical protein